MHTCHAYKCSKPVPQILFMCKPHWFALPKEMRDKIYANYTKGQERSWAITNKYADIAQECIKWLAKRYHDVELDGTEKELQLYDHFRPEQGNSARTTI